MAGNLCPPAYTARAVAIVRESAAAAGRELLDIGKSALRSVPPCYHLPMTSDQETTTTSAAMHYCCGC